MIFPFLLIALQQASAPVSLDFAVGRADKAVLALSKEAGVPMKASGSVASEIVFLQVNKLPVSEVMASLARVTCSAWSKDQDGSYVLFRSQAKTAEEVGKEFDRRLAALESWREKVEASFETPYTAENLAGLVQERARLESVEYAEKTSREDSNAMWRLKDELDYYDPAGRALARCVAGIDLSTLASLEPWDRAVFVLHPNSMQLPLSESGVEAMQDLQQEQQVWGPVLKTKPLASNETADHQFESDFDAQFFGTDSDFGVRVQPWQRTIPYKRAPTNVILTAFCEPEGTYRFELKMFDGQGRLALDFEANTYGPEVDSRPKGSAAHLENPEPSELTKAFWEMPLANGNKSKILNDKLKDWFDDPLGHDYLWFGNQELLSALAKERGKSVIACLPDNKRFDFEDREKLDLPEYIKNESPTGTTLDEHGEVIEIRPASFAYHWMDRANRQAIKECLDGYRKLGHFTILGFAKLVAQCGYEGDTSFGCDFTKMIALHFGWRSKVFELPSQLALIRLLASLDNNQVERLRRGETIPYGELSPEQQKLSSQVVFGQDYTNSYEGAAPKEVEQYGPTFELPQGLLPAQGIRAVFSEEKFAVFHNNTDFGRNIDFYSENLSEPDHGEDWNGPGPLVPRGGMKLATVSFCTRQQITLKCGLTEGHWKLGKFAEPLGPETSKPVYLNQLPQEMQDRLKNVVQFLDGMRGHRWLPNGPPPPLD
jgi:hypothetical protein